MAIVSLHLGQAGVQLGDLCWQQYSVEHGLDEKGIILENRSKPSNSAVSLNSKMSSSSLNINQKVQEMGDYGEQGTFTEGFSNFFQEYSEGHYSPRAIFADMEPSVIGITL